MAKWADYLISAVRYNDDHTRIVQVKQHVDNDKTVGQGEIVSRQTVIDNIESGKTYMTIRGGKQGEHVQIKTKGSEKFITTNPNETTKDNLGELPEF